jgi:uncharacterized protein (DUF849 family)
MLNMGSMNFGPFPMLERFNEFQHPWERDYLESSRDLVFRNTFKDVLATSNAAQVHRARQIIEGLGFGVATPADARETLSLKGADKVAFLGENCVGP